jgi:hypothetical protein
LAALAVPAVKSSVQYFRVRSAVSSFTRAIQSTRYRAISGGCPYNISFSSTGNTFQAASEAVSGGTGATTFTNVGSRRTLHKMVGKLKRKEKMPGRFAEGPRSPGFILPASAVSEQENYGGSRTANLCCIQGL